MDKKTVGIAVLLIVLGLFVIPLFTLFFTDEEYTIKNNPVEKTEFFEEDTTNYPTMLKAEGGKLINAKGEEVVLKGVTSSEPHRLNQANKFSLEYYENLLDFGGNVIRVPVNPSRFIDDKYYMWRFLDLIIKWAGEKDKYVIIDWDCAGDPITGEGDNLVDISNHVADKTNEFWKQLAKHYYNTPNVIFEIYNEPVGVDSEQWAELTNEFIATIREQGANQLIIVSSTNKCYDINWADDIELKDDNLAISMHIFPGNDDYADVIASYSYNRPLIVTAWGYADTDVATDIYKSTADEFGKPVVELLNSNNISWTANNYDDKLIPPMFYENSEDLTLFGQFIKAELNK